MRSSGKLYSYLALVGAVLTTSFCPAQSGDWNVVQQLSSNQAIRVVLDSGKSHRGSFLSATEAALVIGSGEGEQTLLRTNIRRVLVKGHTGAGTH